MKRTYIVYKPSWYGTDVFNLSYDGTEGHFKHVDYITFLDFFIYDKDVALNLSKEIKLFCKEHDIEYTYKNTILSNYMYEYMKSYRDKVQSYKCKDVIEKLEVRISQPNKILVRFDYANILFSFTTNFKPHQVDVDFIRNELNQYLLINYENKLNIPDAFQDVFKTMHHS